MCLGTFSRRVRIRAERLLSYGNKVSYTIKMNPAKQDSPPAAGRASDILPFRCSAIRAERLLSYRKRSFLYDNKECDLAHSRAEARLLRQPSTLAPSAYPRGAFLIVWKRSFLYDKKNTAQENSCAVLLPASKTISRVMS